MEGSREQPILLSDTDDAVEIASSKAHDEKEANKEILESKATPKSHFSVCASDRFHYEPGTAIEFTVRGTPVPKARAARGPRHGKFYNPSKSKQTDFVRAMKLQFASKKQELTAFAKTQALRCRIVYAFKPGTSLVQLPDIDNLIKFTLDSLSKVAYDDDRQLVEVSGAKTFLSQASNREYTSITIRKN